MVHNITLHSYPFTCILPFPHQHSANTNKYYHSSLPAKFNRFLPLLLLLHQTKTIRPPKRQYLPHLVFRMHPAIETALAQIVVLAYFAVVALAPDRVLGYALVAKILLGAVLFGRLLADGVANGIGESNGAGG